MKILTALFLLTLEAPLAPRYVSAEFEARDPQYVDCLTLIAEDVKIGRVAAQQWAVEGGGAPAQHCLAVADLAAGFPRLAAVRLMELADRPDAGDDDARARIRAQAALAFIEAGNAREALNAVNEALARSSLPELHIVAALVRVENEDWQAAADAVTAAEEAGVVSAEGYVARARALVSLSKDDAAAQDVIAALRLDPENLDALVLRGELAQRGITIRANYAPKTSGE